MPMGRRGSYGRGRGSLVVVNSIKNVHRQQFGITSANTRSIIAKAVTAPDPTIDNDVSHGCVIKAIWLAIDFCGISGSGILNVVDAFIMKNPGDNLTAPSPLSQGTSNEKKFIIKSWRAMAMRNQDGNLPYHWEGWIKIPKRYQRMGTDDVWEWDVVCTAAQNGHASIQAIYKWYR